MRVHAFIAPFYHHHCLVFQGGKRVGGTTEFLGRSYAVQSAIVFSFVGLYNSSLGMGFQLFWEREEKLGWLSTYGWLFVLFLFFFFNPVMDDGLGLGWVF
ncbi:hypothetical protein J3F84DRAFT_15269 [Trichoderma pleuroticola]